MIKINPVPQGLFLFFFLLPCLLPLKVTCQDTISHPWDINPRSYVQDLATLASKEQILVQEQIKSSNNIIKELGRKIQNTTDTNLRKQLTEEVKSNKNQLNNLKTTLKAKISISKQYKELSAQSPIRIKAYFDNEYMHSVKITSPVSAYTLPTDTVPNFISSKEIPNSTDSKPVTPKPLASEFKFEKRIAKYIVKNECLFQSLYDPTKNAALEPELLFAYTPDEIKKALRGLSYIKGYAFVGKEPGYTFLQLNIEIASDLALQHYGNLNKSFMNIKLINGKEIRLINSRFDTGKSDPVKKTTSLSGMYYLNKEDEKNLSGSELDKIRLNFVSGYEDYVIYNVDFFTRQLACINTLK